MKLQQEKALSQEIQNLENQINVARNAGNFAQAQILEQKRNQLIVDNTELANRDKVKQKLDAELVALRDKRNVANDELRVLDLIAQGRQDEADALQAALQMQKEIAQIQANLNIGEKEA